MIMPLHVSLLQVRASATEAALEGKSLEDEGVLQAAMQALAAEIKPDNLPQDPSPEYRLSVAQTLLYKVRKDF